MNRLKPASRLPLVIDLDGTLIYSDMLWEGILLFLKQRFFEAWRLPLWLLRGKAGFKQRLAAAVHFDPASLPYDQHLLAMIADQRALGRETVLATGSERRFAERVAEHLQLFDRVFATEGGLNLTSSNKAGALVEAYGEQGFDYVGNAPADIPVWKRSSTAYSVTRRPFQLGDGRVTESAGSRRAGWAWPLLKAMRPRQWLKNLLVFVPMLAGHALNLPSLVQSLLAFAAFSLCASSAYLLNDALDAPDDRVHPTKHQRPIAAGSLPLPAAIVASVLLALGGLLLSAWFDPLLLLAVGSYFVATLAYSLHLKRMLMVDIVALAILYSMRILGGAAATHIVPSFWLLAFSFFVFLSLALLKRYSELFNLHRQGRDKTRGRSYTIADRSPVGIMGINSAFISVLIFMLYFNSQNVLALYPHPAWLIGIVPLLVFWLGRLWALAFRGLVNEDPVLYVSKDPVSLVVVALCAGLAVAAAL
ncbi:MAG TPA: UbiA family prenyltransferase [Telluria sp.]|nr:UbiA family prenyltransferase [Telluria sp.]